MDNPIIENGDDQEPIKLNSTYVPLNWDTMGKLKVTSMMQDLIRKYVNEETTEDAEFEVTPQKQIENKNT